MPFYHVFSSDRKLDGSSKLPALWQSFTMLPAHTLGAIAHLRVDFWAFFWRHLVRIINGIKMTICLMWYLFNSWVPDDSTEFSSPQSLSEIIIYHNIGHNNQRRTILCLEQVIHCCCCCCFRYHGVFAIVVIVVKVRQGRCLIPRTGCLNAITVNKPEIEKAYFVI